MLPSKLGYRAHHSLDGNPKSYGHYMTQSPSHQLALLPIRVHARRCRAFLMHSNSAGPTEPIHAIRLVPPKGVSRKHHSVVSFLFKSPALQLRNWRLRWRSSTHGVSFVEVCFSCIPQQSIVAEANTNLDLHLRNVLVKLPSTFDKMSVQEFRDKFGEPHTVPINRLDEKPLTPNVPVQAVVPLISR